jgi:hypothetical protein
VRAFPLGIDAHDRSDARGDGDRKLARAAPKIDDDRVSIERKRIGQPVDNGLIVSTSVLRIAGGNLATELWGHPIQSVSRPPGFRLAFPTGYLQRRPGLDPAKARPLV